MRTLMFAALMLCFVPALAQIPASSAPADSDHDGLSDSTENALLSQFAPHFMVSDDDCSLQPAQFIPFHAQPEVQEENGTIYGQAFPRAGSKGQVELHYYHLWRRDCGEMGHSLDAEHVSALVIADDAHWKALYWYAAAHENTLCDASQIARASTVDGERRGPTIWISRGKHASFLSDLICTRGCGGDNCHATRPLVVDSLINLGEPSRTMNGATWVDSPQWPLAGKMNRSDFSVPRVTRVNGLPPTTIAWANPEKRPLQAAILGGNGAVGGASTGLHATDAALDVASSSTGTAFGTASNRTGSGLAKSAHDVKKALRATALKLGIIERANSAATPARPISSAHTQ
jgi:hypothetical protein